MTKGDAGQNISKVASSSSDSSILTTSLPYVSYVDLSSWLLLMYTHLLDAVDAYFVSHSKDRSASAFLDYCRSSSAYSDVFVCDGYRLCRSAKLLMSLGYGNFTSVIQYDIYAMAEAFVSSGSSWSKTTFSKNTKYGLNFDAFESSTLLNSPNLSILPLLAYHKICNDHYRNEKWQPFEPWTCNIDYVRPTDNLNAKVFIKPAPFITSTTCIIDLENSNLPIDYFTSVLPRAQYGDEAAVSVGVNNSPAVLRVSDPADPTTGVLFGTTSYTPNDVLRKDNSAPTPSHGSYASTGS